ncbi:hypothetical protein [Amycolatopsis sp. PS_44_ISF1]|uniref:hypothetical protein n=1 Tax=Amycolatopsis sp. PS_44_ISF1 TaxID=2974917 RepID=UPI0028DEA830|nr:hypothetical protein [Amycolatopsis sp. PS_44_ISF1]MDT8915802.1 hypothetical protein [Amycolatopsis sp. PS_44_ISF1]MDT8916269.1 hypothetical protein [Amycolatopsis sp. PS_44_ISF1]
MSVRHARRSLAGSMGGSLDVLLGHDGAGGRVVAIRSLSVRTTNAVRTADPATVRTLIAELGEALDYLTSGGTP